MKTTYLLETEDHPEQFEVTREEWIEAERQAGFSGPGHFREPREPATGGFVGNGYRGLIRYDSWGDDQ